MLIPKELHSGGNYTFIPILSTSLSWSKSTHDKTALWHYTGHGDFCLPVVQRQASLASVHLCGHADGLCMVSILIG